MFNKNFYPTPEPVIADMLLGIDLLNKVVLEPSAGKGNIIKALWKEGAKEVLSCELEPDLQKIISPISAFLQADFLTLTSDKISHVDFIIMNPPFDTAEAHILHAWKIAPEGCQIISLCNTETIENPYSGSRKVLKELLKNNGASWYLGDVFSSAERKTDVEVSKVCLTKPKTSKDEFDGYLFSSDEEPEYSESGIITHNFITETVSRYISAVKMFDSVMQANNEINNLIKPISTGLDIEFGAKRNYNRYSAELTRETFKKELQKSAWKTVFNKMNMQKYITKGVSDSINKFVEQQQETPFTVKNIFKMLEIIVGTHSSRMDSILVEAFDYICSLSAENSTAGEKWKTNSNYKINKKFISPYVCDSDKRWQDAYVKINLHRREQDFDDLIKALCVVVGKNYDALKVKDSYGREYHPSLYSFFSYNKVFWGEWIEWNEFFRVKGFKKGTMHFEFLSDEVWESFNKKVAKIKGWTLPEKTDAKTKGTEKTKKTGIKKV